jgi:hypothetical protein
MATATPLATELWYAALNHPLGVWITTPDKPRLLQLLYSTRKRLDDPALNRVTIKTSPRDPNGEVWLVRIPDEAA